MFKSFNVNCVSIVTSHSIKKVGGTLPYSIRQDIKLAKMGHVPILRAEYWLVSLGEFGLKLDEICLYNPIKNNFIQNTFWGKVEQIEIDYFTTRNLSQEPGEYLPFATTHNRQMTLEQIKDNLLVMG